MGIHAVGCTGPIGVVRNSPTLTELLWTHVPIADIALAQQLAKCGRNWAAHFDQFTPYDFFAQASSQGNGDESEVERLLRSAQEFLAQYGRTA